MKIGILLPTIFTSKEIFPERIFAPRDLCLALCDNLVDLGHQVYLISIPGLTTKAEKIEVSTDYYREKVSYFKLRNKQASTKEILEKEFQKRNFEITSTFRAFEMLNNKQIDILHSYHPTMIYLEHYLDDLCRLPVVYSLHDPLPKENTFEYKELEKFKNHQFISIADSQRKSSLNLNFIGTVYHGLNLDEWPLVPVNIQKQLLFVGRLVREKGLHTAIKTAFTLKTALIIATDYKMELNQEYFKKEIEPNLNNPLIRETGFIDKESKVKVYQNARALLFPIEWEEPFGMVLIEAMAVGTPVIAFNRGSVSEIVKDQETGYIVDPAKGQTGFIEAVQKILTMPDDQYLKMRQNCRKQVEEKFTSQKMAQGYEQIYQKVISKLI